MNGEPLIYILNHVIYACQRVKFLFLAHHQDNLFKHRKMLGDIDQLGGILTRKPLNRLKFGQTYRWKSIFWKNSKHISLLMAKIFRVGT